MTPAIIVHGGAHAVPPEEESPKKEGCLAAVRAGWEVLESGGSAVDAVEAAIKVLEADASFNAGYGSELNADGQVETDAAIMDGSDLNAGGVGAVQGVRNPIVLARRILESSSTLLVAQGAHRFAEQHELELCDPMELVTEKQRQKWEQKQQGQSTLNNGHDTVGCVAIDAAGHLAAGTSTGGTNENLPGRVGDSPLVGCGLYADDEVGACSLTGDGESITRVVLAKTIIDFLQDGHEPDVAAESGMEVLARRVRGEAGAIVIDRQGRIGWAHNAANLACAYYTPTMEKPLAFVAKQEELEMKESNVE
jgi:beta-aspartyl-peptidase (threonine type)